MVKNYLRIALRNILKNKRYIIINTFGLGIALACCISAYILVAFNIEFNSFHDKDRMANIYRIHAHVLINESDPMQVPGVPSPIGPTAATDFSGIKRYVRFAGNATGRSSVSYQDPETKTNNTFNENVVFADSTLFEMFDFPLVAGSHEAFKDLQTVFMDEERAKKYFGDDDPIGKTIIMTFAQGIEKQFTVGGVMKKIPVNSSVNLPVLARFEHFVDLRSKDRPVWEDWNIPATFFELEEGQNPEAISLLFDRFKEVRNESFEEQEVTKYTLEQFHSPINQSEVMWTYLVLPMSPEPLIVFVVLAVMILLIACFNLTNTSIAMTTNRLREIGIRKAVGAHRRQIMAQLMIETVMVIALSLFVGYLASRIIIPEFTTMWELPYGMDDLGGVNLVLALLVLVFVSAILIGLYPAYFGTKFETVSLLRGTVRFKGANLLTRSLVSIQFAISVIVLIAGIIFIQNTQYQEQIDFGYHKEELLNIVIQDESDYRLLKPKAEALREVQEIATTEHQIGSSAYENPITYENSDYQVWHVEFGEKYFEAMDYNFLHGRPIDYENANDYENSAVVTKQFLKTLGIQDEPIGKQITFRGQRRRIVGVIDDFLDNVFRSKDPEPFVFYPTRPDRWRQMVIRADEDNLASINETLEAQWKEIFPSKPYVSFYQEDVVMRGLKQTNRNLKNIFLFLTILGASLSAAGIFSLASLDIARRTKEIGIRRALGASVGNVVYLLNRKFVLLLGIAGLLGATGGYFGTAQLLDLIYAYHIPMSMLPIILSVAAIFGIGWSTTSFTIFRAARANPVETLRDE